MSRRHSEYQCQRDDTDRTPGWTARTVIPNKRELAAEQQPC
jgi:hypothetical protein